MHLGLAPRIPCPLRRFVLGAVSCCRCRLCYLGLPMSTEDLLHHLLRYSYASTLLPVAVFSALRFSRIPAAQALCADVGNPAKCGVIHGRRRFEAARNDAALASVPFLAEAHLCRLSPSTYCRAALVPLAVSRLHVFLRSGSSVFAFVKSMIPAWSDNTDCRGL